MENPTNDKIKIIALFGESGAGKSFTLNEMYDYYVYLFADAMIHKIVSCTTRPKRTTETNNKDYHFITELEFMKMVEDEMMIEHTIFRDWHYGTAITNLDPEKINIGVFNIEGIKNLSKMDNVELYPVYITAYPHVRLYRSLQREGFKGDAREICRRFLADEQDFESLYSKLAGIHFTTIDTTHENKRPRSSREIYYDSIINKVLKGEKL